MKESEFKALLETVIPNNKGNEQYLARLFKAFSDDEHKSVTFQVGQKENKTTRIQNLIDCLSLLHPETAESRAKWTVRLITGSDQTQFTYLVRSTLTRERSCSGISLIHKIYICYVF